MVLLGVSGQALSPARQLHAISRYRLSPKRWALPAAPDKRGLVLTAAPDTLAADSQDFDLDGAAEDGWDDVDGWDEVGAAVPEPDAEGVWE